jgi:hypothetical protein
MCFYYPDPFFKIVSYTFCIKIEERLVQPRPPPQDSKRKHKDQFNTPPKHTTAVKTCKAPNRHDD